MGNKTNDNNSAKLIGHCFNLQAGYKRFEVDCLKETDKQYAKVNGKTVDETPGGLYEYWRVLRKDELGNLRQPGFGVFTMYTVQEDMPRFKELVIAALSERVRLKSQEYESALALLKKAEETP